MKKVIVADDSGTARMFIIRCLQIAGFDGAQFMEAKNGAEALTLLEQGPADLLVTDLFMPEVSGEELLLQVRAQDKFKAMPILVITSAKNPAKEQELMQGGAYAVISKPISPSIMVPILEALS
ncbi:two-component system, chemotaxis family, response regulator CheY [Desulfatibacillum alkenivorans DSM 16219]|jgi:two-component system chemotaxis response regulator CheY|uniref:Two-component system, chemotaxis family, response regulator CheY n=1 Tax=Desulfatibacillum alkenivorans DSM 16219 TaxID=1121393 RepID=A0A1M6F4R6_9BACT|nr:response regulator [Desulfatibacillum alkenivorans]SHI92697.1 two-component system, chemotaxis family, response regulator CheY [Desulfatibacillum alkenivorans DSM 16219]